MRPCSSASQEAKTLYTAKIHLNHLVATLGKGFDLRTLELAHLQRGVVTGGVADGADQDLRVVQVAFADQQAHQARQVLLQDARDIPHAAGHVEQDSDGVAFGVGLTVARQ